MLSRPFRPPQFNKVQRISNNDGASDDPPLKKRRINQEHNDDNSSGTSIVSPKFKRPVPLLPSLGIRRPPFRVPNVASLEEPNSIQETGIEGYYTVLWRKFTLKKHKTWDGDGVLSVRGGVVHLWDVSGKDMGRMKFTEPLLPGSSLSIGGKDVEVDSMISKDDFLAARPFLDPDKAKPDAQITQPKFKAPIKAPRYSIKSKAQEAEKPGRSLNVGAPYSAATKQSFKSPMITTNVLAKQAGPKPTPRHDPDQEGALVMKRPRSVPKGRQIVDVVVDPLLCDALREHQRVGVKFLYECVMGLRPYVGNGAILADEMGLGKTLQTIALLWTLLKQNPIYDEPPVIKKALIVCPVTLISNWRKEFRKWLGRERIGVFVADGKTFNIRDFTKGRSNSVMIIGYEKLRNVQDELKDSVDIVIMDEGHRLKTAKNKSAQAISSLATDRRIILSGTPIQNDLSEFYFMVDLINPGLLGKYNVFRRDFEGPIIRSRQPEATSKELEKGEERNQDLADLTRVFILRRTADVIAKFLPPKTESVIFCRPTQAQSDVYRTILGSPIFGKALGSSEASLQLIGLLKKVCNSPTLLAQKDSEDQQNAVMAALSAVIPHDIIHSAPGLCSGKLRVLDRLLHRLRSTTDEKVVLVSNYTSTLDMLQSHLHANEWSFLRLDGNTPVSKRQDLVDTFNRSSAHGFFAFLLSAKAGGVGINLIGASRLVLFDVDWNPSIDIQAMARIHRDGQRRSVRIYRLLIAGAMDEKIYQRQVTKQGLADSVMDQKSSSGTFSRAELMDLFSLDTTSQCQTHDLLGCLCGGRGSCQVTPVSTNVPSPVCTTVEDSDTDDDDSDLPMYPKPIPASQVDMAAQEQQIKEDELASRARGNGSMKSLMQFKHFSVSALLSNRSGEGIMEEDIDDEVLASVLKEGANRISYVFAKTTS
ncbi:MAG: helicase [Vezdaea acicularis]|nr:MAG: helicase [Vezdaea acicularis]